MTLAAVGMLFTACSDDDDFNTGDATVYVQQPVGEEPDSVRENKTLYVPIMVEGVQNGPINVTVEVVSNSADYVEDKDYIVTSHKVRIPEGKTSVNVEIRLVDERIINDEDNERMLTVRIISANGAEISADKGEASYRIIDNDNSVYERMSGDWTVTAYNGFSETMEPFTWNTVVETYDFEDDLYESEYKILSWADGGGNLLDNTVYGTMPLRFKSVFVGGKEKVEVSFRLGSVIATGLNYDSSADQSDADKQDCSLRIISLSSMGLITSGKITGTVSDSYDRIEFAMPLVGEVISKSNQTVTYMFWWERIVMEKKN